MSDRPLLSVVRGRPTDTEVAALTAVLLGRAAASRTDDVDESTASLWSRGAGIRRQLPRPGADAWRSVFRRA